MFDEILSVRICLVFCLLFSTACGGCESESKPTPTKLDQQPPRILNAFFGLDDALPLASLVICRQAPNSDGMPVTFSRRVVGDENATVDPGAFTVITRSGKRKKPDCATLRPAVEASENHTVLLVGDLGDGQSDPPLRVEITGALPLEGNADAKGLRVEVTPLEDGPTIVMALGFDADDIDSECPKDTKQIIMVVWAGGVTPAKGKTDEDHRKMYRVTGDDGALTPFALGDLGDNDNYVHLCLKTTSRVTSVTADASVLVDPRGDLNPTTSLDIVR